MKEYRINSSELKMIAPKLSAGDRIYLSGTVFTARDAAHKRIFSLLESGEPLPFELENSVIYYAGPTPAKPGQVIGSCGPTTSARMDPYTPKLFDLGVSAVIGKGDRSPAVYDSILKNKTLYLCALGGAGALASEKIIKCEVIGFSDLGCESVKRLEFNEFPLYVGIDTNGNSIFKNKQA